MMVRRAVALGAGLLVLLLLVFGIRGCLDSRKDSAINDWVRDVDALMKESNAESEALFEQLDGGGGGTDVDVESGHLQSERKKVTVPPEPSGRSTKRTNRLRWFNEHCVNGAAVPYVSPVAESDSSARYSLCSGNP